MGPEASQDRSAGCSPSLLWELAAGVVGRQPPPPHPRPAPQGHSAGLALCSWSGPQIRTNQSDGQGEAGWAGWPGGCRGKKLCFH